MTTAQLSTSCSPAWTTRRTDRPSDGAVAARFAAALGRPLIPWQRHVADLAGERDPATGLHAYSRVVVIAPRRAGKSMLMLAAGLAAARTPGGRAYYTSAHRENAARMWRDDWFPTVEASPLRRHCRITLGNGTEAVTVRGGSTFRLVAATGSAIRGAATRLVIIDEARELTVDEGDELERAAFPTTATGAGGQTWIVSSAGDAAALWLARWRDRGRAAVADDRTTGLAYVEYSAPVDADDADESTWWAAHPGLGYHVNLSALRADRDDMTPDAFAVEYLGRWPETFIDTRLVDAWTAAADPAVVLGDPVAFAVEVDVDRERACIVAAGAGRDGRVAVEVVDDRPHGPWVGPRLAALCDTWSPLAVGWDGAGPAAALGPDLADVPTRLVALRTGEVAAASGWFYDAVLAGAVEHRPDDVIDAAVTAARRRPAGGAWLFDRRQPGAGPLVAAVLAAWMWRDGSKHPPTVT